MSWRARPPPCEVVSAELSASAAGEVSVWGRGPREPRRRDVGHSGEMRPAPQADSPCSGRRTRPWARITSSSDAAARACAPHPALSRRCWGPGPEPRAPERLHRPRLNGILETSPAPFRKPPCLLQRPQSLSPVCVVLVCQPPSQETTRRSALRRTPRRAPWAGKAGATVNGQMDQRTDGRATDGRWGRGGSRDRPIHLPVTRAVSGAPGHLPQIPGPCTLLGMNVISE